MATILNGNAIPLSIKAGTVPDMSGALEDWFQPMTFTQIDKQTIGFQLVEFATEISFFGVLQPLTGRRLSLKPEGERAWSWFLLHADQTLKLETDEIVNYRGASYRVMSLKDYSLYGYVEYELVQDWTGSAPILTILFDGGNAFTSVFDTSLDGGSSTITGVDIDGGNSRVS